MKQMEFDMATATNEVKKATTEVKKAATKAKTAVKRKPAVRKVTKIAKKKVTTAKKAVARKTAPKKKTAKKSTSAFSTRAQETSRNVFLASLGFYGSAFDQAQDRINELQDRVEARRNKASKLYTNLVKRGEKVEKATKSRINDIDLPEIKLDNLTDRKKLDAQLKKAKARFEELKSSFNFKKAA